MSGELRTSQFRWTTTADDDFVIGNPSNIGTADKALVFQTTTTPGTTTNPHLKCAYVSPGNWSFVVASVVGGVVTPLSLSGMAYLASTQVFSGATNTFSNDVIIGGNLTVNGTTTTISTTDLDIKDKLITLNKGGAGSSAGACGFQVEQTTGVYPGYFKTAANRLGWELKAPDTAGIITLIPTSTSVSLTMPINTGTIALTSDIPASHAAVTLGTASGLGLSGQQLSLGVASAGVTGALSGTDWSTFNGKAIDANVVHLASPETITGNKAIHATLQIGTYLGNIGGIGDYTGSLTFVSGTTAVHSGGLAEINVDSNTSGTMFTYFASFSTSTANYSTFLGINGIHSSANGSILTRTSSKVTLELISDLSAGSSIILKDKTTGVRYELYIDSGVLSIATA